MRTINNAITGMSCAGCASSCERILQKTPGVISASVNFATEKATITFDETKVQPTLFAKSLQKAGYNLVLDDSTQNTQVNYTQSNDPRADNKQSNDTQFDNKQASGGNTTSKSTSNSSETQTSRLVITLVFASLLLYVAMAPMITVFVLPYPTFLKPDNNPLLFAIVQLILAIPVLITGYKFFVRGYLHLLRRMPNMDSLVALGTTASFAYSVYNTVLIALGNTHAVHQLYFESSAVIIALVMLGKHLESRSKKKTGNAIQKLIMLSPKNANVIRDGVELTISISEVVSGDVIVIHPGESLPADGTIISGSSSIDESMLTGESLPVDKSEGQQVFCGTINTNGSFNYSASSTGSGTLLAKITRLVEEAAGSKAPVARLADKVSAIFVPVVLSIAIISFIIWIIATHDFNLALKVFVSVMVIACPCALGLATPTAIITGIGRAASLGILFRDAAALQNIHKTNVFCFDKTGTITNGKPEVTGIYSVGETVTNINTTNISTTGNINLTDKVNFNLTGDVNLTSNVSLTSNITATNNVPLTSNISQTNTANLTNDSKHLLAITASAEKFSEHPIAKAVIKYAEQNAIQLLPAENFTAIPGNGIICRVDGKMIKIGKDDFVDVPTDTLVSITQQANGSPLFIEYDGKYAGCITVADTIRAESARVIKQLKKLGIETVMLTGDNQKTAEHIAQQAGIDRVIAGVLPDGKAAIVQKLQAETTLNGKHKLVAMVGDGINDAPALTQADFGIAVASGTDIAIQSADVVLTGSGIESSILSKIPVMLLLSHSVLKNIKENLFWAFCYNTIGIPIAAGILYIFGGPLLNPMLGALAMSFSSISVISNALRLTRWKYRF